ncbi:MAG: 2-amino-4-hydroxy-6-hydroxymethyldihydropteridine diphosphokinase [Firmicutes bacterium]|nr:2-amino-4-hydroxy-6-hydroxymethyldihydropteridine diphosphokinase [Bacillota bacterium]
MRAKKAILGLGANLGDAESSLRRALECINSLCKTELLRVSGFYATEAVEVNEPQPPYINCVAEIETSLSPNALLGACLGIESALGRVRTGYKSPRTVDIDLLIYENFTSDSEELTLPHPRMMHRAFVLVPLSELFPDGTALGVEFGGRLGEVAGQKIELYSK